MQQLSGLLGLLVQRGDRMHRLGLAGLEAEVQQLRAANCR